ncbi:MAG: patatin-like phospholipase family protein [Phototrophicaceae bacterium]
MQKLYKILSVDGGGIRGIIPAIILAEIERRSGQPIVALFDLVAGSSTGAILAMGLNVPDEQYNPRFTAEEMARLYETEGATIFSRSMWRTMQSLNNITTVKYPATGIDSVLDYCFGDLNLSDSLGNVLITSYEIQRRQPWFFRSSKARHATTCDFKMHDVVRASTAAPTYFEPAQIFHPDAESYFALIDGAMQANNPALCAYVEARDKNPHTHDFMMLSLGTGDTKEPIDFEEARTWGLAGWSQHLLDIVFDAMSSSVDYQIRRLLPICRDGHQHYYRFQTRLDGASDDLDNVTVKNIDHLKQLGYDLVEAHDEELDRIVDLLLM